MHTVSTSSQLGLNLVPTWSQLGLNLVSTGSQLGPNLVSTLSQLGLNLVPTWSQLGPNLVSTWSQLGPNLVSTWSQLGLINLVSTKVNITFSVHLQPLWYRIHLQGLYVYYLVYIFSQPVRPRGFNQCVQNRNRSEPCTPWTLALSVFIYFCGGIMKITFFNFHDNFQS